MQQRSDWRSSPLLRQFFFIRKIEFHRELKQALAERSGSALPSTHSGSQSSRIAVAIQSSQRPGLPRVRIRRMSELLTTPARSCASVRFPVGALS